MARIVIKKSEPDDKNPAFWMQAKRDGKCAECGYFIMEGDRMVWDTKENKAYCEQCGGDIIDGH
jgi:hypothetical protein